MSCPNYLHFYVVEHYSDIAPQFLEAIYKKTSACSYFPTFCWAHPNVFEVCWCNQIQNELKYFFLNFTFSLFRQVIYFLCSTVKILRKFQKYQDVCNGVIFYFYFLLFWLTNILITLYAYLEIPRLHNLMTHKSWAFSLLDGLKTSHNLSRLLDLQLGLIWAQYCGKTDCMLHLINQFKKYKHDKENKTEKLTHSCKRQN